MATVTDYTGNAGLGLGSNSDIPAVSNKDLDAINQTTDRLLAINATQNHYLFQQKIRDRDKLYEALDSGDIKVGDLLERDMPVVKSALDKLDEAYFARIKKGVNDLDAAAAYKKALRAAQDATTQAQARKVFNDAEVAALTKETLPRKQAARKSNLEKSLGSFWSDITPYQQTQDLDINGSILSTAQNIKEQYTDPKNPLFKGTRTAFDYGKTLMANSDNFLNNADKRHDQEQLLNAIQSLPPLDFLEQMKAMNNRIKEYNTFRNLTSESPDYVPEVKYGVDAQTGMVMINEKIPDFAAKYTLAHQKPFDQTATEFDDKYAGYLVDKERLKETARHNRAEEGLARDRLNLDKGKFENAKSEDIINADAVIMGLVENMKKARPTGTFGQNKNVLRFADPTLLKTFAGIEKDGATTKTPDEVLYNKKNDQFELIYFDEDGAISNKIPINGLDYLSEKVKQKNPNKDIGGVNNIVSQTYSNYGGNLWKLSTEYNKKAEATYENDANAANWKDNGNGTFTYIPTGQIVDSKTGKLVK